MSILAMVEIARRPDGTLPRDLLRTAYRASRRGRIILVLNGVSPEEVDREIDVLVKAMPLNIPGFLYVNGQDAAILADSSARATMIFVSRETARFWRSTFWLASRAVRAPDCAGDVLGRIARPARLSEMAGGSSSSQGHLPPGH